MLQSHDNIIKPLSAANYANKGGNNNFRGSKGQFRGGRLGYKSEGRGFRGKRGSSRSRGRSNKGRENTSGAKDERRSNNSED